MKKKIYILISLHITRKSGQSLKNKPTSKSFQNYSKKKTIFSNDTTISMTCSTKVSIGSARYTPENWHLF